MTCMSIIETKQKEPPMDYTKDELLAETGIEKRGRQLHRTISRRKERKAIQFAEAENVVEHFLENRLNPKFPKTWNIDLNHVMYGEIPSQYFLDTLGKLEIFQTDPLGEQQAIHRVLVALVKADILKIRTKGQGVRNRLFRIVDAAYFCKSNDNGEQPAELKIVNIGG